MLVTLTTPTGSCALMGGVEASKASSRQIWGSQTHQPPSSMTHGGAEGRSESSTLTGPAVAAVQICAGLSMGKRGLARVL